MMKKMIDEISILKCFSRLEAQKIGNGRKKQRKNEEVVLLVAQGEKNRKEWKYKTNGTINLSSSSTDTKKVGPCQYKSVRESEKGEKTYSWREKKYMRSRLNCHIIYTVTFARASFSQMLLKSLVLHRWARVVPLEACHTDPCTPMLFRHICHFTRVTV